MQLQREDAEFLAYIDALIGQFWPRDRVSPGDLQAWRNTLIERGLTVPTWPESAGGSGWSTTQIYLWFRQCRRLGAPSLWDAGCHVIGPVLLEAAARSPSDLFFKQCLEGIRNLEETWCTAAADDATALDMAAGSDHRLAQLSGQISSVVGGMNADWVMIQASQNNVVIVNLRQSGITRVQSTYDVADAATIKFDQVPVAAVLPRALQLDQLPQGTTAGVLLGMVDVVKQQLTDEADSQLSLIEIELQAFNVMELRYLDAAERGVDLPFPREVLQVRGEEIYTQLGDLLIDTFGYYALPSVAEQAHHNEPGFGPRGESGGYIQKIIAQVFARTGIMDPLIRDKIADLLARERKN
ncbi:MAG: hypothetical protein AAF541_07510 [Pseudomonadota bacterium]